MAAITDARKDNFKCYTTKYCVRCIFVLRKLWARYSSTHLNAKQASKWVNGNDRETIIITHTRIINVRILVTITGWYISMVGVKTFCVWKFSSWKSFIWKHSYYILHSTWKFITSELIYIYIYIHISLYYQKSFSSTHLSSYSGMCFPTWLTRGFKNNCVLLICNITVLLNSRISQGQKQTIMNPEEGFDISLLHIIPLRNTVQCAMWNDIGEW